MSLIFTAVLVSGGSAHALAHGAKKESTPQSQDRTLVRTLILDLRPVNCPEAISTMINDSIRARMKRIPYCYPVPDEEIRNKGIDGILGCRDRDCAVKYARQLDCKKVIIGSVIRLARSKKEQLGTEGEYKYIYEVKPYDEFIIKIDLIDVPDGSIDVKFREKAKKNEINARLDLLPVRLRGYFAPIPPPEPPRLTPWIGVSPSCIIPLGKFAKIIGAAGGVTLDVGLRHIVLPNIYAKLSGSYYFAAWKKNNVRSYQSGQLSILGGYAIQ
ncbi:MAG: hypothetical protein JXA07_01940 [Spirochaetes bacterium]|nr:hypothetical protein [Spirochaetota bacterium]